jgi:hypothetical protein
LPRIGTISCIYDEFERGYDVDNAISYSTKFSDTVNAESRFPTSGIAFVSTNSEQINYIAKFKKSGRVATKIDRLSFTDVAPLTTPIEIKSLIEEIPRRFKKHIEKQISEGVNRISAGVYSAIRKFINENYPDVALEIDRILFDLAQTHTSYSGNSVETIAYEKDAISLSLRVSGFTNNDIPRWEQKDDSAPFISGFEDVVIREDPMVIHDSQVFGDWSKIKQFIVGAAEFTNGKDKLTIMNVNRHKIEETLGVDLIIYHHKFRSYILIQYKRLTKDGNTLSYRPTDRSYRSELERMVEFQANSHKTEVKSANDYRLNNDFFYFKLCPAQITNPLSTEMIKGMYLPLTYWEVLMKSKDTEGERGGRVINYENTHRYINNTLFIELVQNGWVGSQIENTELITRRIIEAVDGKRSVILANYTTTT